MSTTKTAEELAEQRAYIESLTSEQRAAFDEYVIAVYNDESAGTSRCYWQGVIEDYEEREALTGQRFYPDVAKDQLAEFERQEEYCVGQRNGALARLDELAPEGHYFDEQTGRYAEKGKYTGVDYGGIDVSVASFWNASTVSNTSSTITAASIQKAMDSMWNRLWPEQQKYLYGTFHTGLAEQEKADAQRVQVAPSKEVACECGAHKASNAPRGSMHSSWCPWRAA